MPYSFIIGPGNGFRFIHEVLERRPWWNNLLQDYDAHYALGTAQQGHDSNRGEGPVLAKLRKQKRARAQDQLLTAEEQEFHLCWRPLLQVRGGRTLHTLAAPSHLQLVNHFSNVRSVGTKTGIARALAASFAREGGERDAVGAGGGGGGRRGGAEESKHQDGPRRRCVTSEGSGVAAAAAAEAAEVADAREQEPVVPGQAQDSAKHGTQSTTADVPFVPTTYIVTSAHGDEQISKMSNMFQHIFESNRSSQLRGAIEPEEPCEMMPSVHCGRNMWLLKPASQNCGVSFEEENARHASTLVLATISDSFVSTHCNSDYPQDKA